MMSQNILINICDSSEGTGEYERDDMEDIMTRTPPTNITNLNYIRNYFKIDKIILSILIFNL